MSVTPHMISIVQKASNVCGYCRSRKQKCDRMYPRCQRCATKNQECDCTVPYQSEISRAKELVCHKACGHADLTPHGATELVHAVKTCIDSPLHPDSATNLMDLVAEILYLVSFDRAHALTVFGPCIQQWCPIFVEDQILGNCDYKVSEPVNARDGPEDPVLWMALWLVLRKPCSPYEDMGDSELYSAIKQVHALMQRGESLELGVLQIGMIISIYEMGHGLRSQAFQTLATCTATFRLLELDAERKQHAERLKNLAWIKASVTMLDRQLSLSTLTECLPLTIPTGHPISVSLRKTLAPGLPTRPPYPHATSPWKVFIRTGAAVSAGPALEYIYSQQRGEEPQHTYDEADSTANRCISMLVIKPDSPAMFHCDAVPMIVCAHIRLQSTHIQHLCTDLHTSETPAYLKAIVALKFSRSVAWETVRTAIRLVSSEESISRLTFAGVCSVLRAGLTVLETRGYVNDGVILAGEVEAYMQILKWFAGRWVIGNEYLARVEQILGSS